MTIEEIIENKNIDIVINSADAVSIGWIYALVKLAIPLLTFIAGTGVVIVAIRNNWVPRFFEWIQTQIPTTPTPPSTPRVDPPNRNRR